MGRVGESESAFERKRERGSERERQTQRGRLVPDTETRKSRGGRVREREKTGGERGREQGNYTKGHQKGAGEEDSRI